MKKYVNGKYIELTHEELVAFETERNKAEAIERSRKLTESEVLSMLIPTQINTLSVDDNTALRMINFYPEWTVGASYTVGYKVNYGGKLWRVLQAHTSLDGWQPDKAASLWEQINETHSGTLEDPVPYEGHMALESGKYYIQNNEFYLSIRDTVNPVYNALSELVGLYVEKV